MSATKTQAYILKTQDYRDTSLLAQFYTKDYGKIHGIVRGVRDARGRFGSTLEPFSLNEILFYRRKRGGVLHQVTQVDLVDVFPAVREDLERLSYASYFTELLNQFVELEDPSPELFELLSDSLAFLAAGASPRRCARIFELKLFEIVGLMPEIRNCVRCGKADPDPAFFNVSQGGIHCRDCHVDKSAGARIPAEPRKEASSQSAPIGTSIPVSKGTILFLQRVQRSRVSELTNIKVSQEVGEELEKILRRFVDFHLSNKPKSVIFLEKMGWC